MKIVNSKAVQKKRERVESMGSMDQINSVNKISVNLSHNIPKTFFKFHQSPKFCPIVTQKTMNFSKSKF